MRRRVARAVPYLVILVLLAPALYYPVFKLGQFNLDARSLLASDSVKLGKMAFAQALDAIARDVPPGAAVLDLSTSGLVYYSPRRLIKWFDPRLAPLYRAPSVDAAAREVRALGVEYVYAVPAAASYPPLSRTRMGELLGDSSRVEVVFRAPAMQREGMDAGTLYRLRGGAGR